MMWRRAYCYEAEELNVVSRAIDLDLVCIVEARVDVLATTEGEEGQGTATHIARR